MDISIIVPTFNREERLRQCLESIFNQDYPQGLFEIIVVDDGSNDGTVEMLKRLARQHPNLRYFLQLHKGPAAARNLGMKEARAEIIGFTDDDCVIKNDWIRKMVEAHRLEQDTMAIGGSTKVNPRNIRARVSQSLSDGAIKTNINGRLETIFFPTCNVSIKKEYLDGDKFDELFPFPAGEDLELFWRLYKKGGRFIHRQDIEIFHNCHSDFKSFLKQAYMYGRGNLLVQYIHNDHHLLKEIKTKNYFNFIFGLTMNLIKIPRFSYLLGRRLINSLSHLSLYEKSQIFLYFTLHKIMYLIGNTIEYLRLIRMHGDSIVKVVQDAKKTPIKPEFIILDITHRCNLNCNICEIRKDKSIKEFTTQEVKNLISQAIDWGIKEFVLSGGEPLVREDIFELLEFIKEKGYRLGVLTNGILLDKDFIKRLLPYLIADILSFSISLDSLSPEVHDDIRGRKGCFEKTFDGLKILSELKGSYPKINFNVISIILNENLEELLPLTYLLKSFNVDSIQFQPLLANNMIMKERSNEVRHWVPHERLGVLDGAIDSLIEFKKQNSYLVRNSENNLRLVKKYFRGDLTNDDVECQYAAKTMLIANNGDVTTCFGYYGNVREAPLKNIWSSYLAKNARAKVKNCKHPCLLPCFVDY